jgi:hypothetical protein
LGTPSGRKVTTAEEREEKKTPLIVDTLFGDSSHKLLGPKTLSIIIEYKIGNVGYTL